MLLGVCDEYPALQINSACMSADEGSSFTKTVNPFSIVIMWTLPVSVSSVKFDWAERFWKARDKIMQKAVRSVRVKIFMFAA